jgi:hypothetical protein
VIAKMLFDTDSWFGHNTLRGLLFCLGAVSVAVSVAVVSYESFKKRCLRLKRYFKPSVVSTGDSASSVLISADSSLPGG